MAASDLADLPRITPPSLSIDCGACKCKCNEFYNEGDHVPRLLVQCGHSLCEQCLKLILRSTADGKFEASCASCGTVTTGGGEAFPKNSAFLDHIQSQKSRVSVPETCELCKQQHPEFGCGDCKAKLCGGCWPKIHAVGALLTHFKGALSDADRTHHCFRHQETLNYMCLEASCPNKGDLICYLCKDTAPHKGHQTEVFENLFDSKQQELQATIDRLTDCAAFSNRVLTKAFSSEQAATNSHKMAVEQIEDHFEQLINHLRVRKEMLIQQANDLVESKVARLKTQRRTAYEKMSALYSGLHSAVDAMKLTDHRQFLLTYHSLQDQFTQLGETNDESVSNVVLNVQLSGDIGNAIQRYGVVSDDGVESVIQKRLPLLAQLAVCCQTGLSGSETIQFRDLIVPSALSQERAAEIEFFKSLGRHTEAADLIRQTTFDIDKDGDFWLVAETFARRFGVLILLSSPPELHWKESRALQQSLAFLEKGTKLTNEQFQLWLQLQMNEYFDHSLKMMDGIYCAVIRPCSPGITASPLSGRILKNTLQYDLEHCRLTISSSTATNTYHFIVPTIAASVAPGLSVMDFPVLAYCLRNAEQQEEMNDLIFQSTHVRVLREKFEFVHQRLRSVTVVQSIKRR